jgi:lipopolysaccharide heptosyltransferase II
MNRLVVLAPNWLGDAVMALPAVADVRRASPDVSITIAARPVIAPLFSLVQGIDEIIVLPRRVGLRQVRSWPTVGAELAGRQFDAALLLPNSIHAALAAYRAHIPERWGYRAAGRSRLLTRAIHRPSGVHQVDYYRMLVHALGFPNGAIEPRVTVPVAARDAAVRMLRQAGWDAATPLVALAPGAAYGGAKRWPPPSFAGLAAALAADDVRCVMIGSAADTATGEEVVSALGTQGRAAPLVNLIGRTDLPMLAGVLSHCRALVTNDSGAMHLGAAVGISVTAVFGPTNEIATGPLGDAHRVLTHPVWCRPCMLRECPIDHRCLRGIGVAAVLDAARRTL